MFIYYSYLRSRRLVTFDRLLSLCTLSLAQGIRQTTVNQGCIYLAILQQIKYTVNHAQIKRRMTDHCTYNGIGMLSHSKKQQAY